MFISNAGIKTVSVLIPAIHVYRNYSIEIPFSSAIARMNSPSTKPFSYNVVMSSSVKVT